jgi:hypothetical protein
MTKKVAKEIESRIRELILINDMSEEACQNAWDQNKQQAVEHALNCLNIFISEQTK